jgi:hypothetical protein
MALQRVSLAKVGLEYQVLSVLVRHAVHVREGAGRTAIKISRGYSLAHPVICDWSSPMVPRLCVHRARDSVLIGTQASPAPVKYGINMLNNLRFPEKQWQLI